MSDGTTTLTERPAWQALGKHYEVIRGLHLRQLFAADPGRGEHFAAEALGIYFDYSKNRLTDETIQLLVRLAEESGLRCMWRCEPTPASICGSTAGTWCPKCMPYSTKWPHSPIKCALAHGRASPASGSAMW